MQRFISWLSLLILLAFLLIGWKDPDGERLAFGKRILGKYSDRAAYSLREEKTSMTLGFGGDVFLHLPNIEAAFDAARNTYDFAPPFERIRTLIGQPDFTACALGANYAEHPPYTGYPLFISPVELLHTLKELGLDIVFATNHVFDGGEAGFLKRNRYLEQLGFEHPGEFATAEASREILILEKENIKTALLSYTYGTNGIRVTRPYMVNLISKTKMQADIEKARQAEVDFIIVYLHQGEEYEREPAQYQQETARFLAGLGVDVIVCSHPHVVQRPDVIKAAGRETGRTHLTYVLTYSLGNLYCGQRHPYTQTGLFVSLILEKEARRNRTAVKRVVFTPTYTLIRQTNNKPVFRILPIAATLRAYQAGVETGITAAEAQILLAEWKNTVGLISDPRLPAIIR